MATAGIGVVSAIADSFLTAKTCPLCPEWSAMAAGIGDHRGHRGQKPATPRPRARGRKGQTPYGVCATGMVKASLNSHRTLPDGSAGSVGGC